MPLLHPLLLSLLISLAATLLSAPAGILTARFLHIRQFPGKSALETVLLLPLVLPPVMTGLALLLLLGRNGPLGFARLLFTPWAAILAAAIVSFPLAYQSARGAFNLMDRNLEDVAASLGARPRTVFWTITLPLAWPGLAGGAVLAFARCLGEFGATVMVLGNVLGRNLTTPVAIYNAAEDGNFRLAGQYSLALGILTLATLSGMNAYLRKKRWPR